MLLLPVSVWHTLHNNLGSFNKANFKTFVLRHILLLGRGRDKNETIKVKITTIYWNKNVKQLTFYFKAIFKKDAKMYIIAIVPTTES